MAAEQTVDLTNCDREPIHIPGSIQPHGALVGFDNELRLAVSSRNAAAVLGVALEPPTMLEDLVGARSAAIITELARTGEGAVATTPVDVRGRPFDVAVHRSDGLLITEFEPTADAALGATASFETMRGVVLRLSAAGSVDELCDIAASEVRTLTGFDRVMVYRFDEHWNGEVIAEDRREDLNPFLGLHYPATDIPQQARALYQANWLRLIADVGYAASPLEPDVNPLTAAPLDLSHAVLRSVSPIHIEYLTNMGVSASMSISLINEGVLWGLIACHHYSGAHRPAQPTRAAAEFLGQVMSLLIASKQRADDYARTIAARDMQADLSEALSAGTGELPALMAAHQDMLLQMVNATGAAVRIDDVLVTIGATPADEDVDAIASWLWQEPAAVVATASLGRDAAHFAHLTDVASGVLGVSVTTEGVGHVLWFRPEVVRTVDWGGDPKNKVIAVEEDDTIRLSPRKSFDLWKETVRGTSTAWSALDRDVAADLARHIAGLLVQHSQAALDTARTLQRSLAPDTLPSVAGLDVETRYRVGGSGEVGGDWYDVLDLPDDGVAVVIGDVAGHGVPAATTMAELRHAARAYLLDDHDPGRALSKVNRVADVLRPGEVATCLIAVFEADTDEVRIASAGHPPPLLLGDGWADYVAVNSGPAIGLLPNTEYAESVQNLGDATLLLYTDGLIERRGEAIDVGLERLASASAGYAGDDDFLDRVMAEVPEDPSSDDMAIMIVRRARDRS